MFASQLLTSPLPSFYQNTAFWYNSEKLQATLLTKQSTYQCFKELLLCHPEAI